mgnify:CR=1 FL=1
MAKEAIGMIECKGLVSLMEASDAALKSADVTMTGWEKIGSGLVTAFFTGNVAAVKAAIETGRQAVGNLGKLIAGHVIARPHEELIPLLPAKPK